MQMHSQLHKKFKREQWRQVNNSAAAVPFIVLF